MNERAGCLGKSLSRVLLQLGKENDKRQKAKGAGVGRYTHTYGRARRCCCEAHARVEWNRIG